MRRGVSSCFKGFVVVGLLVVAGAGPASAAVTIGQASPVIPTPCSDNFVATQRSGQSAFPAYSSAAYGVITAWSSRADGTAGRTVQLIVVRPEPSVSPTAHTIVGIDQIRELTMLNQINTFTAAVRLPIEAGQKIGLHIPDNQPAGLAPNEKSSCAFSTIDANDVMGTSSVPAPPAIGETHSFGDTEPQSRLNASAVVEPDADRDGYGDETQDSCPTSPLVQQGACPPPPCSGLKAKARKRCLCKQKKGKARKRCLKRLKRLKSAEKD